jgi:hypothetical protein
MRSAGLEPSQFDSQRRIISGQFAQTVNPQGSSSDKKGTYTPNIAFSDTNHLGAGTRGCDITGRSLSLGKITADDAGIGSKSDEGAGLRAADGTSAAGHESDAAVFLFDDVSIEVKFPTQM